MEELRANSEGDIIDNAYSYLNNVDNETFVKNLDVYRTAMEIQTANEKRVRKEKIERRRLNQLYEAKIKKAGFAGFIAGTAMMAALSWCGPQIKGRDILGNKFYEIMQEQGYGFRDDSQAGIIFNQGSAYVSTDEAISDLVSRCKEEGMSDADIDVGMDAVLGISTQNSTLSERIDARNLAYHMSKVEEKGMGL